MARDANGRAYLQCSDCCEPVYYTNDGEEHCGCDPEPDAYRIGSVGEVAAEFQGQIGGGGQ